MKPTYDPANVCIYCKYSPRPKASMPDSLSKEHILAFSLGGNLVLRKASCGFHRDETSKFEGVVAQDIYLSYRDRYDVPTRHGVEKRTARLSKMVEYIGINYYGEEERFLVPFKETPSAYLFTHFNQLPTVLTNLPIIESGMSYVLAYGDEDKAQAFLNKYKMRQIHFRTSSIQIGSPEYFRTLAKTAHAFLWAEMKGSGFDPCLIDIIEGRVTEFQDFLKYIGQEVGESKPKEELLIIEKSFAGETYFVVKISIRAFKEMPCYHVVAGRKIGLPSLGGEYSATPIKRISLV